MSKDDGSQKAFNLDEKLDEIREKLGFENKDAMYIAILIFLLLGGMCGKFYLSKEAFKGRNGELEAEVQGLKDQMGRTKGGGDGEALAKLREEMAGLKAKHRQEMADAKQGGAAKNTELQKQIDELKKQLAAKTGNAAQAGAPPKDVQSWERSKYYNDPKPMSDKERQKFYQKPKELTELEKSKFYKKTNDSVNALTQKLEKLGKTSDLTAEGAEKGSGSGEQKEKLE